MHQFLGGSVSEEVYRTFIDPAGDSIRQPCPSSLSYYRQLPTFRAAEAWFAEQLSDGADGFTRAVALRPLSADPAIRWTWQALGDSVGVAVFEVEDPMTAAAGTAQSSPDGRTPTYHDPTETIDENIDVESILEQVPDDQKRLAFRLYMDDVPFKSKKSDSISAALGVSEKTAREWVKEVQALLSSAAEVQELLKPKQMRENP